MLELKSILNKSVPFCCAFYNLVVDPGRVGSSHIFRLKKYLGAVIVSEEVKRRLMAAGVVGVLFDSVNGDKETVA
ncbi:imm11 family protein [Pseudomonas sp. AM4(2022)]|uniref:imm11 family protein n=1 Tax=Pseudomonas sp. AM4(2022) TaxID=2983408 RepID=UPI002E81957C|nr:DUF1629 domain-containing protein [Pseudomonas sp. AM4(2022)]